LLVSIFSSLVFQECHVIQSTNHNRETVIFVCENYYYVLKNRRLGVLFHLCIFGCGENLTTNALKHLMDQLEEKILQIDQLKNASKRLHRVDRTLCRTTNVCREVLGFLYLIVNQQFVVWQKHTNKISPFCNAPNGNKSLKSLKSLLIWQILVILAISTICTLAVFRTRFYF